MRKVLSVVGGLLFLSTPAFGQQTCRDRVDQLERELSSTRQQLYAAQDQLRRVQQHYSYPPYRSYGGQYPYGQGPLYQGNQTLQQLEQMRRHLDNLTR
jgi:hypothetical protein